ncbi:MAG: hypothetical protein NTU53_16100 [Planctomycetota bacterium]|nr:hypothetical protein [Planctomycetota bacterium]
MTEVPVVVIRGNSEECVPDGIHDGVEGAGRCLRSAPNDSCPVMSYFASQPFLLQPATHEDG